MCGNCACTVMSPSDSSGAVSIGRMPPRISVGSCDPGGRIPSAGSRSGLSPREPQRQLRQIPQELKQTGAARIRPRLQLKPGTRLMREWQGRTYEVVVRDDGQSRCNATLLAAAGFQNDESWPQRCQPPHQLGQPVRIGRATEHTALGPDMQVDPRFRNIDADKAVGFGLGIHYPAFSMRARAQTTARVHGMPAGATRSLSASRTRTHSGCRPVSASQTSPTNQAMPR
jgi:hypothetical protein